MAEPQEPQATIGGVSQQEPKAKPKSIEDLIAGSQNDVAPAVVPQKTETMPWIGSGADFNPFTMAGRFGEGMYRDVVGLRELAGGAPMSQERYFGQPESIVGGAVQGIAEFMTLFSGAKAGIKAVGKIPWVAKEAGLVSKGGKASRALKYGEALAAGGVADFIMSDQGAALSEFLRTLPSETAQQIGSILATEKDDTALTRRLKGTLEGIITGGVLDAVTAGLKAFGHSMHGERVSAQQAAEEAGILAEKAEREEAAKAAQKDAVKPDSPPPSLTSEDFEFASDLRGSKEQVTPGMAARADAAEREVEGLPPAPATGTHYPALTEALGPIRAREYLDQVKARAEKPMSGISQIPGTEVGESIKRAEAGRVTPWQLDDDDLLITELRRKDANTRQWEQPRDTIEVHRLAERLADETAPNFMVEPHLEQMLMDRGLMAEWSGSKLSRAEEVRMEALVEAAKRKPALARQLAKLHRVTRIYSALAEGHANETIRLAKEAVANEADELLQARALDAIVFQRMLAAEVRAARSEMGRGLGSLSNQLHLTRDEVVGLKEKIKNGYKPSTLEQFALESAETPYVPLTPLVGQSEKYLEKITQLGGKTKIMDVIRATAALSGIELPGATKIGAVRKLADSLYAPKFLEFPLEWFINALVSGPRTIANVLQQQTVQGMFWQPVRRMIGAKLSQIPAAMRGDKAAIEAYGDVARGAWRTVANTFNTKTMQGVPRLVKLALSTGETTAMEAAEGTFAKTYRGKPKITYDGIRSWIKENMPNVDPDGAYPTMIYWLATEKGLNAGHYIRLPGRLLTATDELTKQVVLRANIAGELEVMSSKRFPHDPNAAAKWADDAFQEIIGKEGKLRTADVVKQQANAEARDLQMITGMSDAETREHAGKLFDARMEKDADLQRLVDFAGDQANEAAATLSPPPGSSTDALLRWANNAVWPRFFLPFIRSSYSNISSALRPLDIAGWAELIRNARTPQTAKTLGALKHRLSKDLLSLDPRVRADAMGRIATSAMMLSTVSWLASQEDENGLPRITGAGPKSKSARSILRDAGWLPYSVSIPGIGRVSYARADPAATMVGIFADVMTLGKYASEEDFPTLEKVVNAGILATTESIRSKTYLQGLVDITDVFTGEKSIFDWGRKQLGSAVIPNVVPQVLNAFQPEESAKDVQNMLDLAAKRMVFWSDDVPNLYDVMGKPKKAAEFAGPDLLSGWQYTNVNDNEVRRELANIGATFDRPDKTRGGIDLLDFKTKDGTNAYERWQQLIGKEAPGGKTLEQMTRQIIKQPWYQKMSPKSFPGNESPRLRVIRNLIERYRSYGYWKLTQEIPELAQAQQKLVSSKMSSLGMLPR